ncbi:PcfB family protein [Faecalitalea cylindroides]|uniref:PcfB family protein n=1 Tax=Faecalitalea cylindroides TaxID=39483 RepID=UPI0024322DF8|nr:PcfB family protein [Faecalitalea cylindroides]
MYASGDTADQMVKMTLEGIEVAANITLKAGGSAAKSLAATLYAILTDKKKVKGKTHLNSLLKSGKELKVFAIRHEDLKIFCEEAKRYGVLYSVLKEKNNKDGICDVMVRAEDASKISRIVDKFELAKIDTKAIKEAILAQKDNPIKDIPVMSNEEHDKLVNELMNEVKNPTKARKTKSDSRSGPFSKSAVAKDERPSVKKQLADIKSEKAKTTKPKSKTKVKTPRKKVR